MSTEGPNRPVRDIQKYVQDRSSSFPVFLARRYSIVRGPAVIAEHIWCSRIICIGLGTAILRRSSASDLAPSWPRRSSIVEGCTRRCVCSVACLNRHEYKHRRLHSDQHTFSNLIQAYRTSSSDSTHAVCWVSKELDPWQDTTNPNVVPKGRPHLEVSILSSSPLADQREIPAAVMGSLRK